eukprot:GHVH01006878.1.p1 GENE.GHVH01006878.1~~GHVH01006878.1.p1  ORF type:complete len:523 (-),score=85.62 GHVH01006878.1:795-2363(-)
MFYSFYSILICSPLSSASLSDLLSGGPTGAQFNYSKGLDYVLNYAKDLTTVNNKVADNLGNTGAAGLITGAVFQPIGTLLQAQSGILTGGIAKGDAWSKSAAGLVDGLGFLGKARVAKMADNVPVSQTLTSVNLNNNGVLPVGGVPGMSDLQMMMASGVDITSILQQLDVTNQLRILIGEVTALELSAEIERIQNEYPTINVVGIVESILYGGQEVVQQRAEEEILGQKVSTDTFGGVIINPNVGSQQGANLFDAVSGDLRSLVMDSVMQNSENNPLGAVVSNFLQNSKFLDENNLVLPLSQLVPKMFSVPNSGNSLREAESKISAILAESLNGVIQGKEMFEPAIKQWQANKLQKEQEVVPEVVPEVDERIKEAVNSLNSERRLQSLPGQSSLGGRAVPTDLSEELGFGIPNMLTRLRDTEFGVPDVQNITSLEELPDDTRGLDAVLGVSSVDVDVLEDEVDSAMFLITATADTMMEFVDNVYATWTKLVPFLGRKYTHNLMSLVLETVIKLSSDVKDDVE